MDHIHRAIEKQKQPLPGDQSQAAQGGAPPPQQQQQPQAAPPAQPAPEQEHHHGKQVAGGLAKAGEFGFGASLGSAAANAAMGAFKG